ncbi:UNVERIFIED_CONTAM: hypothetical protein FKN15_049438 [Acipenser sinensis]
MQGVTSMTTTQRKTTAEAMQRRLEMLSDGIPSIPTKITGTKALTKRDDMNRREFMIYIVNLTQTGCLADAKASGLSSSGYELSQYIDSTDQSHHPPQNNWSPVQTVIPALGAPLKFPLPHVRVSFCPGGQLVRVSPNLPSQGELALIEIHSLEVILVDTQEQEEMRAFPGPLVRQWNGRVSMETESTYGMVSSVAVMYGIMSAAKLNIRSSPYNDPGTHIIGRSEPIF